MLANLLLLWMWVRLLNTKLWLTSILLIPYLLHLSPIKYNLIILVIYLHWSWCVTIYYPHKYEVCWTILNKSVLEWDLRRTLLLYWVCFLFKTLLQYPQILVKISSNPVVWTGDKPISGKITMPDNLPVCWIYWLIFDKANPLGVWSCLNKPLSQFLSVIVFGKWPEAMEHNCFGAVSHLPIEIII